MELLELFHRKPPRLSRFMPRKKSLIDIDAPKINLYGARGSGKSALAYDFIARNDPETILYIDLEDPALILYDLESLGLERFIDQAKIETLIVDHYEEGMLERIPEAKRTIVISRTPISRSGFFGVSLSPLDFEEFLLFDNAKRSEASFNRFFKKGRLPAMARLDSKEAPLHLKRFIQYQFTPNEQCLLLILARYNAATLTTHQIYTYAKEHFRISKDWLYATMQRFTEEGIVRFIAPADRSRGKKMILYDFALAKFLSPFAPFKQHFDSLVASALLTHERHIVTLGRFGYLSQEGEYIVTAPFDNEAQFLAALDLRKELFEKYPIKRIIAVTVSNRFTSSFKTLRVEGMPFYEFALLCEAEASSQYESS